MQTGNDRNIMKYVKMMILILGFSLFMLGTNILSAGDIYEAENATLNGVVVASNQTGFSGSGFGDYINSSNDYIEWNITVANAGDYQLKFRYALASGNRPLDIAVNGIHQSDLDFNATGDFSTWDFTDSVTVSLPAGPSQVRATAIGYSGANVDYLEVTAVNSQTATLVEAEDMTNISGVAVSSYQTGYSGSGYIDYVDSTGAYVEWEVNAATAGDYTICFGYALASGDRPLEIKVNGTVVESSLSFPNTGSFTTWGETTPFTVALNAGVNLIRATAIGYSGANVDYLKFTPVSTASSIFEAEDATAIYGGGIASNQTGFSGSGFVDYVDTTGAYVTWNVEVQNAGNYDILFGYALSSGDRPLEIKVNGTVVESALSFPNTGSWTTWGETAALTVPLQAGANTITATSIGYSGANVDYLKVMGEAAQPPSSSTAIPMIVDTDMMTDCDDTGALAIAHRLDHDGEISLIGVIVSTHDYNEKHCNVVSAINTYYGKPNIPIGLVEAATSPYDDWNIVRTSTCPFSVDIYNNFPHDGISNRNRPDSTVVYRQLLHDAADHSVVIVVIGHLNAVANLMQSGGDNIDSRNGIDLITAKVKKLVVVGGTMDTLVHNMNFNGANGYDSVDAATQYWLSHWPDSVELVDVPDNVGDNVETGQIYQNTNTPMETAYIKAYDGINGRPSWDQTAIIAGARGSSYNGVTYWQVESNGCLDVEQSTTEEKFVHWSTAVNKNHSYMIDESGISNSDLAAMLSNLMDPSWVNQ